MIQLVLVAHVVGLVGAAVAGRFTMRAGLLVAAIAPALSFAWAITELVGSGLAGPESPARFEFAWVERLDLRFVFLADSFALLAVAIVSGIGALVFVYASGYFSPTAAAGTRFPVFLLAFSTSMLGLVLAESVWTLFFFWEMTSVTSFLLVGHAHTNTSVQDAARRALMITGGGGLALLAGLLLLARETGSSLLSELEVVSGTSGTVAAILVLVGVATKSAQVPFHVWLPGAMAAPTPVSAYLHSATMVKAGIILMAVTGSAFADSSAWKIVGFTLGSLSMIWGGIGALRHRDAKLILAWGTISQLGLLVTLLALGTGKAVFAAVSIVVAHALFKATLFLVVGEIDIRTGTREIDELGGLYKTMPLATAAAVLAGLSMAGAPPLLGFVAKEAAIEASLELAGTERVLALLVLIGGSVLTVAYTTRFLWTVFGPGPATVVKARRWAMTVPASVLALSGLVGYVLLGSVNDVIIPASTELNADAFKYELIAWPGLKDAFVISMAILVVGIGLGAALSRSQRVAPEPLGASGVDRGLDGVLSVARRATARVQHGSLPVYLAIMALTVSLAATPFFFDVSLDGLVWWDHPLQMMLALALAASAFAGAFVDSRLGAALTLGAVGIAAAGLFVVQGAPDLALTQLLVETIIVVGFVVGLGHLGRSFPRAQVGWQAVRISISVMGGLAVMAGLIATSAHRTASAPIGEIVEQAVDEGGGNNVVNVILTDLRALDTLGEVVVLATVAIGILALARARDGSQDHDSDVEVVT